LSLRHGGAFHHEHPLVQVDVGWRLGHHVIGTFELADFDQARGTPERIDARQQQ
jgi:hypothetical protein